MIDTDRQSYYRHGVLPIVSASALWAFGYFVRKLLLVDISAVWLSFVTSLLACVMISVQYHPHVRTVWATFGKRPVLYVALACSGTVCGTTLMYFGLERIDLGVASILEKLQPVFTLIFGAALLRERVSKVKILFVAVALAAACVLTTKHIRLPEHADFSVLGALAVVGAAASWGLAAVIGKMALNAEDAPEVLAILRFGVASLLLLPVVLGWPSSHARVVSGRDVALIVGAAYFSTVQGYMLYYKGLRYVSAGVSGFLELVTPIVALALGVTLLSEHMTRAQAVAAPVLLVAVLLLARRDTGRVLGGRRTQGLSGSDGEMFLRSRTAKDKDHLGGRDVS
jgi:drug/metabolite transporter (DMT)-like permease